MRHDWMHKWRRAVRAHSLPVTLMGGMLIHALRMMSFLMHLMPNARNFEKAYSILRKVREIILWGNSDNCSCQSPEVCICTWYIPLYAMYIIVYISIYYVHIGIYLDILSEPCFFVQHAHIENIKTVANLSNNKDVFMCILRFHAHAGYLQTY